MPIFTAIGGYIATSVGLTAGTVGFTVVSSISAAAVAAATGQVLGVFDAPDFGAPDDQGVENRINANTQNKVPCLYGNWMQRGIVSFYETSEDRQELYTVLTLGEGPATSINRILWDEFTLTLDSAGEVTTATDPSGETTDRFNGRVNVQNISWWN